MRSFLKRHWFLLGIAAAWALGLALPAWALIYQRSGFVDIAIALVMLCGGLSLDTARLLESLRNGRLIVLSTLMMFVLAPLLCYLAALPLRLMPGDVPRELVVGFMLLGAQSCTLGSGIAITTAARGNVAVALVVTVVNSMLGAILTPALLGLTLSQRVETDVPAMIGRLSLIILLPVAAGQVLRRPLVRRLGDPRTWSSILTQCVILSVIFMAVGSAARWMRESPGLVLALAGAVLTLHIVLISLNYALAAWAGFDMPSRRALTICASQKTLATGSYLWARHFADHPLGAVPLTFYHVAQLVFDSLLAHRWADGDARDRDRSAAGIPSAFGTGSTPPAGPHAARRPQEKP